MMKKKLCAGLAIWSVSVFLAAPVIAAGWKAVPVEVRNPAQPLPVAVHLVQNELRIGTGVYRAQTPDELGLVGALMLGAIESGEAKKAHAEVEPLLRALGDFDAGGPLMTGIRSGVSAVPWLSLQTASPLRDNSIEARNALLSDIAGDHIADVDCSYEIGQAFEALFARCIIQIADKRIASEKARWKPGKLLLHHVVQTEVALDMSSATPPLPHCFGSERRPICREKWSENAASLLRRELTLALGHLGTLVGENLVLSEAQVDSVSQSRNRILLSGLHGGVIHQGTVLKGLENITDMGRPHGWSGGIKAILKNDSDGAMILEEEGAFYHRKVVTE